MICRALIPSLVLTAALVAIPAAAEPATTAIETINAYRADHDLAPLSANPSLRDAAQAHAEDLADVGVLSHQGSDGSDLGGRLRRVCYPYRAAAENLAMGPDTAAGVLVLWIGSEGHRENLLRADLQDAGVGRAEDARGRPFWVLKLARARGDGSVAGCHSDPLADNGPNGRQ